MHIKENLIFDPKDFILVYDKFIKDAGKFPFMILNPKNHRRQRMVINSITVEESNEVILLGITIDNKLVFKQHTENLRRTVQ